MKPSNTNMDAVTALEAVSRLQARARYDLQQQAEGLALLRAPDGVKPLLRELAAADDDKSDHFTRFVHETARPYEEQSAECQADWSRALGRYEAAVRQLVRLAKALPAENRTITTTRETADAVDMQRAIAEGAVP